MEAATCAPNTFDVLTLPSSGITRPANLAGKTIAVNLIQQRADPDHQRDPQGRWREPRPRCTTSSSRSRTWSPRCEAHQVDAISAVEPFATAAELTTGALPILDQCQGPTGNFPMSSYYATAVWARQHPAAVLAFQKAMAQAQAIADNSRGIVEKTIMTYIPKLTKMEAAILALVRSPPR